VEGVPALDTEGADTRILIANGGTVVIGGIILSSSQTTIDQVPFLGDIPPLGNLFKHLRIITSSQELLFFLTPRILPG
jgi:type IV pilus assembly protein PilQ